MANQQKELSTIEKGAAMIEWAEKVKCPKIIKINDWTTITDTTVFLSTQVETMKAHKPKDKVWALAYMRIYELKTFLINQKQQKQNEKAS